MDIGVGGPYQFPAALQRCSIPQSVSVPESRLAFECFLPAPLIFVPLIPAPLVFVPVIFANRLPPAASLVLESDHEDSSQCTRRIGNAGAGTGRPNRSLCRRTTRAGDRVFGGRKRGRAAGPQKSQTIHRR